MRSVRICYLVTLYQKFEQAARLVQRLDGPGCGFVFHIDSKVSQEIVSEFGLYCRPRRFEFARRERWRWGSFNGVRAIMNSLEAASSMGRFDRYVLLSGQDYPIVSNRHIGQFFERHATEEFIETRLLNVLDAGAPGWSPHYRFSRYHVWIGSHRRVLPFLRKGPPPLPVCHGSTWWALTHQAVTYLLEQFEQSDAVRSYFRSGFLVEEACIQSLMYSSPFRDHIVDQDVTFAKWTPDSGPHPKVLRQSDLQEVLKSGKLFARKMDAEIDSEVLDALDQHNGVEAWRGPARFDDLQPKVA
jgi:hypothetical protein